jgi:hypothetical protein
VLTVGVLPCRNHGVSRWWWADCGPAASGRGAHLLAWADVAPVWGAVAGLVLLAGGPCGGRDAVGGPGQGCQADGEEPETSEPGRGQVFAEHG